AARPGRPAPSSPEASAASPSSLALARRGRAVRSIPRILPRAAGSPSSPGIHGWAPACGSRPRPPSREARDAREMANILTNSEARRDYHIHETYEAGIVLKGTEVKALRAGLGQITDAFARVENGEMWLHNAHIDEYSFGNRQNHVPKAPRKL